jgi:hypothetical protein
MHMMSRLLFLLTSRIEDRRCDVVIGFTYFRSLPVFCFRTLSVVDICYTVHLGYRYVWYMHKCALRHVAFQHVGHAVSDY